MWKMKIDDIIREEFEYTIYLFVSNLPLHHCTVAMEQCTDHKWYPPTCRATRAHHRLTFLEHCTLYTHCATLVSIPDSQEHK